MASLAEELKLLSLPAPSKISLDDFHDDRTSARVVSKDDVYNDESENIALNKSNLRQKAAILFTDEDKRYAGEATTRKDLNKLRGDVSDDVSDNNGGSSSDSEHEKQFHLEIILDKNYDFNESGSDLSGSGESEDEKNEEKEREDELEKQEELDDVETQDREKLEEEKGWDESEVEEDESGVMGKGLEDEGEDNNNFEGKVKLLHSDTGEVQKGKAVVHQIALWDSVLENRIRLQKMLVDINKLPQYDVFDELKDQGGGQVKDQLNNTQQLLTKLLYNLLILQQTLYEKNSDTVGILKKEDKPIESDEEIPSDNEDDNSNKDNNEEKIENDENSLKLPRKRKQSVHLEEYSEHIAKRHQAFEHFRDATIKKWNEKTRLASGKVNNKSYSSFDRSTLNQIKQILNDKERLIKRTQLKRSSYRVLGKAKVIEDQNQMEQHDVHLKDYDTEIFDDDDFYHQLLREFIERKSNVDPNDPIAMGRQWLEIQRLRNKVKRKVDTKASKGRRLRYDVHTKLVSFMAPQNRGTMPDSSRNELFSSLFGKRQSQEPVDITIFR